MKKHYFLILFFVLKTSFIFSQNSYILKDEDTETVETFEVLPDENYTFEQVLTDSSLLFIQNPTLLNRKQIDNHDYFWIRFVIKNDFSYDRKIYIRALPMIENEIYVHNKEVKKWEMMKGGYEVVDFQRKIAFKPILLSAKKIDTLFIRVKTSPLREYNYLPNLVIHIQKESYFEKGEERIAIIWVATLITMISFFLYNLYVYFVFKDKTYLYYLLIIVGGIVYISATFEYFDLLFPFRIVQVYSDSLHSGQTFNINTFSRQLSTCLIMFGFVKFTISYLQLTKNSYRWNKVLHYMLYGYIIFTLITAIATLSGIYYLHTLVMVVIGNTFILFIIISLIVVGILSLRKGYKPARYFLWANASPFLAIIVITIFLIKNPSDKYLYAPLFSSIGIVAQAIAFAIALVARVNLLKDELQEKQLQAQKLKNENETMLARNRYIELENEYIMADMAIAINREKELQQSMMLEIHQKAELEQKIEEERMQKVDLQSKLEANQRELTANTLYLQRKNELLINLQKQIQNLSYKDNTLQNIEGIKEIKSVIKNDIQLDSDWDNFKLHFEQVHPSFFKELNEKYPTLTKNEIRLAAYYHLNMSVKEIATLLNIDPRSVHKAKSRLNKKMEGMDNQN